MTKAQVFRDQTIDELEANILDLKKELFGVINGIKTNKKNENAARIRIIRRDIARILTIIREKQA